MITADKAFKLAQSAQSEIDVTDYIEDIERRIILAARQGRTFLVNVFNVYSKEYLTPTTIRSNAIRAAIIMELDKFGYSYDAETQTIYWE